jgi:hypothetical protein
MENNARPLFSGWLGFTAALCLIEVIWSITTAGRLIVWIWGSSTRELALFTSIDAMTVAAQLVIALLSASLMFQRSKWFPCVFATSLLMPIGRNSADMGMAKYVSGTEFDPFVLLTPAVLAAIFIPYVFLSERVKTTFGVQRRNSHLDGRTNRKSIMELAQSGIGLALFPLPIAVFLGWVYWLWLAIQIGSFAMFLFGLLGPLAIPAALMGLWALIFGTPHWFHAL